MNSHLLSRHDEPPRRALDKLTLALGVGGVGLLVYLIADVGPARIVAELYSISSILPAVLLLTALKYPLQTAGWRLALPRQSRPPWAVSLGATITGDALGYLTWAGPFTGEPMRALLIRDSVPVVSGIAAGGIERGIYNLTAALLVASVLLLYLSGTHGVVVSVAVVAGSLAAGALGIVLRRRHRASHTADLSRLERTPTPRPELRRGAALLEAASELWSERRHVLPAIVVLCVMQHALLVGEAYLMLNVLADGMTLRAACTFEALTKIVNTVGIFVPGRLGVAEGGSAALAGALGFTASQGLSLALMRRVRALIWGGVGIVLLPFEEARARKAALARR